MSAYSKQDSRDVVGRFSDSAAFWASFVQTVPLSPRAFLGTYLKEAVRLRRAGRLDLADARFEEYAARPDVSDIDRRKILTALLPHCQRLDDAERLLRLFGGDDRAVRAAHLLRGGTLPCHYLLFREMQQAEGDTGLHERVCRELIRRGTQTDFNHAALLCAYFDLSSVRATFALRLAPYQLSRYDGSYPNFCKLVAPA
ncbi:MAG: hypothetical protein J6M53_04855 [Bacteroidaceae bacterium]|nr:hypothetical protein [Bacteroidaceae bacterium]